MKTIRGMTWASDYRFIRQHGPICVAIALPDRTAEDPKVPMKERELASWVWLAEEPMPALPEIASRRARPSSGHGSDQFAGRRRGFPAVIVGVGMTMRVPYQANPRCRVAAGPARLTEPAGKSSAKPFWFGVMNLSTGVRDGQAARQTRPGSGEVKSPGRDTFTIVPFKAMLDPLQSVKFHSCCILRECPAPLRLNEKPTVQNKTPLVLKQGGFDDTLQTTGTALITILQDVIGAALEEHTVEDVPILVISSNLSSVV